MRSIDFMDRLCLLCHLWVYTKEYSQRTTTPPIQNRFNDKKYLNYVDPFDIHDRSSKRLPAN